MSLIFKDRVKETTSTTGTGDIVLAGAADGYQAFSAIGDGNTTYYCIVSGNDWEVGVGTYTLATTTLSRDTILDSSTGSAISLSGTSTVFCTYAADKSVSLGLDDKIPLSALAGITTSELSASANIANSQLANSSITITAGTGLGGGGSVSLGGTVSINASTLSSALSTHEALTTTAHGGIAAIGTGTDRSVIVRDGTGRNITDSLMTIAATTGLVNLTGTSAAIRVYDSGGTDYLSLSHDGTSGRVTSGAGSVRLVPESGEGTILDDSILRVPSTFQLQTTGGSQLITVSNVGLTCIKSSIDGSYVCGLLPLSGGGIEVNNGTAGAYRDLNARNYYVIGGGVYIDNFQSFNFKSNAGSATYGQIFLDNSSGAYGGVNGLTFFLNGSTRLAITPAGIVSFGPPTSSYPAIKRNGTGIDVRLADDSAYTSLASGPISANAVAATDIPLVVQGAAGQSANLQSWTNSSSTVLAKVSSAGVITGANIDTTMNNCVAIGGGNTVSSAYIDTVSIGYNSGGGYQSVAIGTSTSANNQDYSVSIGYSCTVAAGGITIGYAAVGAAATAVIGSSGKPMTNVFFGKGITNSSPTDYTINGTGGSGTDVAGASLNLAGGIGTGTGVGGNLNFKIAIASSSGSSANTLSTVGSFSGTTGGLTLTSPAATTVPLTITLAAAQSANAITVNNSSATTVFSISSAGAITTTSTITATGTIIGGNLRAGGGGYIYWANRCLISSPIDSQILMTSSSTTDFGRLQFGGTTSSYPSIKRNGAGIDIRLADDSNYANLAAANLTSNGNPVGTGRDIYNLVW